MIEQSKSPFSSAHVASAVDAMTAAMRSGVRESLWMHKRLGHPVAIWDDGRVRWIPAEDIPGPESPFWAEADRA